MKVLLCICKMSITSEHHSYSLSVEGQTELYGQVIGPRPLFTQQHPSLSSLLLVPTFFYMVLSSLFLFHFQHLISKRPLGTEY